MVCLSHGVNRNQIKILLRSSALWYSGTLFFFFFLRLRLIQPGLFRQALFIENNTYLAHRLPGPYKIEYANLDSAMQPDHRNHSVCTERTHCSWMAFIVQLKRTSGKIYSNTYTFWVAGNLCVCSFKTLRRFTHVGIQQFLDHMST